VFAFDPHGDGAGLFVGGEFDFVAALQVDLAGLGQREVFDVFGGAGVAGDADVGGGRGGFGDFGEVGDAAGLGAEFEAFGVAGEA